MVPIRSSEITPEHIYLSRRKFMLGLGAAALLAACGRLPDAPEATVIPEDVVTPEVLSTPRPTPTPKPDIKTAFDAVTGYVNYYEFSLDKEAAAVLADESLQISPWTVTVGGLVNKPRVFDIEELLKFEQEERVYRMRCVEGWSMVIPWLGFPLSRLLKEVEPLSNAKYVRFQTLADPDQMPGLADMTFPWPYIEGLRLDEAMHDLTLIATGLYGWSLRPSNGAPLRLVVPWKYGFKSLKSIVRIDLVEEQPTTFWMAA
ncbi:MAG: protein-methionine-sulfoxide reductase catalytic subunit MsrP, partial [Anaerolineae bacterium]|nr:protein-methionine-sulfoxide reductase catalytic subunit MsrP [Anaerolineae bacterium]